MTCNVEIPKWVDIVDYMGDRCLPIINRWTNSGTCSVKASISKQNTLRYLPNAGSLSYIRKSLNSASSTIVQKISQLYTMVRMQMKGGRQQNLTSQRKSSITGHYFFNVVTCPANLAFSKFDSHGGDTFLSDLITCLRLTTCDHLVILDCLRSLEAFTDRIVKNRKFDLLASAGHDVASSGENLPHWLTRTLNDVLKRLLNENPKGFSTSDVYRELYYTVPFDKPCKPLLFDQAQDDLGRVWLRPQVQHAPLESQENCRYLKLGLKLNVDLEVPMMNEICLHLQKLPHVEQVEFGDLPLPRKQLTDFMRMVLQAQRIRPLIRKMVAKRRWRMIERLGKAYPHGTTTPSSPSKLSLSQDHQPTYDWSKSMQYDDTAKFVKVEDIISDAQTHLGDRKRPRSSDTDQGSPTSTRLRSSSH